jgi:uncharacterized membrane protein YgcG
MPAATQSLLMNRPVGHPSIPFNTKTGDNLMNRRFETVAARRAYGNSTAVAKRHLSKAMRRLVEQGIYLPMAADMVAGEMAATGIISDLQMRDNMVAQLSITPLGDSVANLKEVDNSADMEANKPTYDYDDRILRMMKRRLNTPRKDDRTDYLGAFNALREQESAKQDMTKIMTQYQDGLQGTSVYQDSLKNNAEVQQKLAPNNMRPPNNPPPNNPPPSNRPPSSGGSSSSGGGSSNSSSGGGGNVFSKPSRQLIDAGDIVPPLSQQQKDIDMILEATAQAQTEGVGSSSAQFAPVTEGGGGFMDSISNVAHGLGISGLAKGVKNWFNTPNPKALNGVDPKDNPNSGGYNPKEVRIQRPVVDKGKGPLIENDLMQFEDDEFVQPLPGKGNVQYEVPQRINEDSSRPKVALNLNGKMVVGDNIPIEKNVGDNLFFRPKPTSAYRGLQPTDGIPQPVNKTNPVQFSDTTEHYTGTRVNMDGGVASTFNMTNNAKYNQQERPSKQLATMVDLGDYGTRKPHNPFGFGLKSKEEIQRQVDAGMLHKSHLDEYNLPVAEPTAAKVTPVNGRPNTSNVVQAPAIITPAETTDAEVLTGQPGPNAELDVLGNEKKYRKTLNSITFEQLHSRYKLNHEQQHNRQQDVFKFMYDFLDLDPNSPQYDGYLQYFYGAATQGDHFPQKGQYEAIRKAINKKYSLRKK